MADALVGDIIEIETTDDHTASSPTWTVVGQTKDTVTISPNTEIAEQRLHGSYAMDKSPVTESWEMAFSANVVTGTAQLEALDLYDTTNDELKGSADSRELSAANPAITVSVYATENDAANGNVKYEVGTDDYIIIVDTGEIGVEDFATREMVIHSRTRPIRLDAGGTF